MLSGAAVRFAALDTRCRWILPPPLRRDEPRRPELVNPVASGMRAVAIVGEEVRLSARREPSERPPAHGEAGPQQRTRERQRRRKAERRDHLAVEHRVDAVADQRREDAREPRDEQIARRRANALVRSGEAKALAFVRSA